MNRRESMLENVWHKLREATARDLMNSNPRSIHQSATVLQAAQFLVQTRVSAAPVIDDAGRPVGVLSRSDVLRQLSRSSDALASVGDFASETGQLGSLPVDRMMTRAVFSVRPDTPAAKVLAKLMALEVGRLFVVDRHGVLIGVVSDFDLLRPLVEADAAAPTAEEELHQEKLAAHAMAL